MKFLLKIMFSNIQIKPKKARCWFNNISPFYILVELEGVEPSSKQGTQRFSTYLVLAQLSGKDIAQNRHYSIPYVVSDFAPLHDHSIHYPI